MFQYGHIQFRIANTEDLIRATQRLRYRVYVEEFGWEKPEDHPEGIETDAFDPYSIHAAALNDRGELIGTARMVLNSELGLPAFRLVEQFKEFRLQSRNAGEISRFCVDPDLRRYGQEVGAFMGAGGSYRFPGMDPGSTPSQDARMLSLVPHGLMFALFQVAIRLKLTHWMMVSEKKLWVFLKRRGIVFHPAGQPVDYHGIRTPYVAHIDQISHALAKLHRDTVDSFSQMTAPEVSLELESPAAA